MCNNLQSRLCELNDDIDQVHNTIFERDLYFILIYFFIRYLDTLIHIEKVSKTLLESVELTNTNREVLKEILSIF